MTHRVRPCPANGFAQPPLLGVFAPPSAVSTLSPSASSALPMPGRCNRHRLATTTAPRSWPKTTQDNIKTEVGYLECHRTVNNGASSAARWFRGSEVRRFDAGAKDGGNHGLCLHGADLMGMDTAERRSDGAPAGGPQATGGERHLGDRAWMAPAGVRTASPCSGQGR